MIDIFVMKYGLRLVLFVYIQESCEFDFHIKKYDRKNNDQWNFFLFSKKNGEENSNFFSETTIFLFLVKIDLRLLKRKLEKITFRRVRNI